MADLQALFDAHYPDRRYLTELCDHYYCDFLSVAVLRRSKEKSVRPFTHRHAAAGERPGLRDGGHRELY